MAKLTTLNVANAVAPFAKVLGKDFDKVVRDISSMLGRITDKEIDVKHSDWKASAGFKLKAKDGYTVQLAPNNPASILLCFGMRLNELADNGSMEVEATIPKACESWVEQHRASKLGETAPAVKA